jgi:hypothetical protein
VLLLLLLLLLLPLLPLLGLLSQASSSAAELLLLLLLLVVLLLGAAARGHNRCSCTNAADMWMQLRFGACSSTTASNRCRLPALLMLHVTAAALPAACKSRPLLLGSENASAPRAVLPPLLLVLLL